MPGGRGNRRKDRTFYEGFIKPNAKRHCPEDFRERYLEMGWEAQWYYSTNWRVMCRWIDESGGEELCRARREWLRQNGNNMPNRVTHVGGWTAEKLDALHRG